MGNLFAANHRLSLNTWNKFRAAQIHMVIPRSVLLIEIYQYHLFYKSHKSMKNIRQTTDFIVRNNQPFYTHVCLDFSEWLLFLLLLELDFSLELFSFCFSLLLLLWDINLVSSFSVSSNMDDTISCSAFAIKQNWFYKCFI